MKFEEEKLQDTLCFIKVDPDETGKVGIRKKKKA